MQAIMANTKFYLDTRAAANGQPAPLKISITHNNGCALLGTGISLAPANWDKQGSRITGLPNRQFLNTHITKLKMKVDEAILAISESGRLKRLSATELKNLISKTINGEASEGFSSRFLRFAETKNPGTKSVYMQTFRRMKAFDRQLETLGFEDIDKSRVFRWIPRIFAVSVTE